MLEKRTQIIIKIIFLLLGVMGGMMLLTSLVAVAYGEVFQSYRVFLLLGVIGLSCGLSSFFMRKVWRKTNIFRMRDGFVTVMIAWVVMVSFSALPYYLSGAAPSFTDAFFESMSGYTTTGTTVFPDVESLPKSILLWRGLTQWVGGIGIIVFFIAFLPVLGLAGNALFAAEFTAPLGDKIRPRLKDTAKILCVVYIAITLAETILLKVAGMSFFDALCHSLSTVATGGFSTKNSSLAEYSPAIQYIITLFMFLSGINYLLYYFIIKKQVFRVAKDDELRTYFLYIFFACLIASIALYYSKPNLDYESAFRLASLQCVSVITTTGFVSAEYNTWTPGLRILLLLLMFSGACAGSSTGGIKISRIVLMVKNTLLEFKRVIHPRAVLPLKYNQRVVGSEMMRRILAFFFLYMSIFVVGVLCFAFMGYDAETSFAVTASSMGNVGPYMGQIGSMCAADSLPIAGKWLSSWLMLVGRLGIFTVLVIALPSFWKNK